jgi:predicted dinucleotide-binding enzyme
LAGDTGEQVAGWVRGAKVVKAFKTVGSNIMENPAFGNERPVLFFCGDDAGAMGKVKQLAGELGFEAVDAGPLTQARVLEPFALLWISLAFNGGLGHEFAFKLLRR